MTNITEKTAPNVSVGADTEQPSQKCTANIITTKDENFKSFEEIQREMIKMMDPSYLKTVSMTELYDTVYQSKPPLIDGLLYPGTYIFAGAPKLGKSFLMAQLAYHVSTGTPLWNYTVRKGTALYLALEDDYRRLQERFYRMFGDESTDDLFIAVNAGQLGNGLDEQLNGPTSLAVSAEDPVAPAKVLKEYADKIESFQILAGYLDGVVVDKATVEKLADIPSKEVLIAKLLGSIKSPLYGFAYAIQAIIDKDGDSTEAPAAEEAAPAEEAGPAEEVTPVEEAAPAEEFSAEQIPVVEAEIVEDPE